MSINACSINEFTINTLCGRRRQAIIDSLRPIAPPVVSGGHHPQHVGNIDRMQNVFNRRDSDHDIDVTKLEQQHMQVTIEFAGQSYAQTLERNSAVPVVSIYGLSVHGGTEEQVNITDVKIKVL